MLFQPFVDIVLAEDVATRERKRLPTGLQTLQRLSPRLTGPPLRPLHPSFALLVIFRKHKCLEAYYESFEMASSKLDYLLGQVVTRGVTFNFQAKTALWNCGLTFICVPVQLLAIAFNLFDSLAYLVSRFYLHIGCIYGHADN